MLSKLSLMSRKSVETFLMSICRALTSCERVVQASTTDSPARESHRWGLSRPVIRATKGKAVVHYPLKYLGAGLKENHNMKGGGGVISGLTRLIQKYTVGFSPGRRVETIRDKWQK